MRVIKSMFDSFLYMIKKTLVRFRKAKFGLLFIKNISKIGKFINDPRVNIISKAKVFFAFAVGIIYILSGIDFVPELITGILGLFDDMFVLIWTLGIINEELEKYNELIGESHDSNVIRDVTFTVKDDEN